jgi:hypothetical protein
MQPEIVIAGIGIGIRRFIPRQSGHGEEMLQAKLVFFGIRKDVSIFREEGRDLLLDATNQVPIDSDPDQHGIHTFRHRLLRMNLDPLESLLLSIAFPTRKILLDDEFAVFGDEHAVHVLVAMVEDPEKQRLDHIYIEVLTAHMGGLPTVVCDFRNGVLIRLAILATRKREEAHQPNKDRQARACGKHRIPS